MAAPKKKPFAKKSTPAKKVTKKRTTSAKKKASPKVSSSLTAKTTSRTSVKRDRVEVETPRKESNLWQPPKEEIDSILEKLITVYEISDDDDDDEEGEEKKAEEEGVKEGEEEDEEEEEEEDTGDVYKDNSDEHIEGLKGHEDDLDKPVVFLVSKDDFSIHEAALRLLHNTRLLIKGSCSQSSGHKRLRSAPSSNVLNIEFSDPSYTLITASSLRGDLGKLYIYLKTYT